MRLIGCYIENFGVLKEASFEFDEKFTAIKQDNGYGKTTLAAFIKAMFYGLPKTRKDNLFENERKKYAPWDGGRFGGNLTFEADGKRYKIERYFEPDTFALYDAGTNKASKDFNGNENIGQELFKIDADSYARSIYAPQEETAAKMTDSIAAKLNNLLYDTDDVNNFEKAVKKLDERRAHYKKKRGDNDEITLARQDIEILERKIQTCEGNIVEAERLKQENERLLPEIAKIKKSIAGVEEKIVAAHKIGGYNALKSGFDKVRREIRAREEFFGGNIAKEDEIKEVYKDLEQLKNIQYQINETDLNQNEKAELAALKEQPRQNANNGKKSVPVYVFALGAAALIMIIAGILLISSSLPAAVAALAAGLICAVTLAALVLKNSFSQKINAQAEMLNAQRYNILKQRENQVNARRGELSSEAERITRKINGYLSGFNFGGGQISERDKLEKIKNNLYEYQMFKGQERDKRQEIEQYIREYGIKEEDLISPQDEQTLTGLKRDYENQLSAYNERLIRNAERIKTLGEEAEKLTFYSEKKEQRAEYLKRCEFNLSMLDKAMEFLERAKDGLASKYSSKMQQSFVRYADIMASGIGKAVLTSDLEVYLEYKGENKQTEYLSKGYRNVFQVCARLALIESLFENEKPFIILDDPFVNLDEGKIENALRILEKLSENIQIIYLVCHGSRVKNC